MTIIFLKKIVIEKVIHKFQSRKEQRRLWLQLERRMSALSWQARRRKGQPDGLHRR